MKKTLFIGYLLIATLVLAWNTFTFVAKPSPDLSKAIWTQKDLTLYNGAGPYEVRVRLAESNFHPIMWHFVPRYEVAITHKQNPDYGHLAAIDFDDEYMDGLKGILRTKVAFDASGVTVTQPRGKRLFIPKSYFLGGR
jgi:hypothetical protein